MNSGGLKYSPVKFFALDTPSWSFRKANPEAALSAQWSSDEKIQMTAPSPERTLKGFTWYAEFWVLLMCKTP